MAYTTNRINVRFSNLPFTPEEEDVIYMEYHYDGMANKCITENMDFIRRKLDEYGNGHRFIYLPTIYKTMAEAVKYDVPYPAAMPAPMGSDTLLRYMADTGEREHIRPCFMRYSHHDDDDMAVFIGLAFDMDGPADAQPLFDEICSRIPLLETEDDDFEGYAFECKLEEVLPSSEKYHPGVQFSCINDVTSMSEAEFEQLKEHNEVEEMMREVKEKIDRLRQSGVSEWALRQLITPERRLSRLVITKDMRLMLPDYDMEITMEPIHMAVYLLFLNHPEGIIFKAMSDHRDELTRTYTEVCRCRGNATSTLSPRQQRCIDNIVDPTNNSLNEKVARIRATFISRFTEDLASSYCITGQRGEPKRISLPRKLVEQEQ